MTPKKQPRPGRRLEDAEGSWLVWRVRARQEQRLWHRGVVDADGIFDQIQCAMVSGENDRPCETLAYHMDSGNTVPES